MGSLLECCLIADDHAMMRAALSGTVRLLAPDARIETAADFPSAIAQAAATRFDLVLCDLAMPGAGPLDGVLSLMRSAAGSPVLVITGSEDDDILLALLDLGVAGFLHKTASGEVVEAAIALVAAGGTYLPPRLLEIMRERRDPPKAIRRSGLTARQKEVLVQLVRGSSNKEIARQLAVSPATVKAHVAALLGTLNVRNRSEAIALALAEGWLDD